MKCAGCGNENAFNIKIGKYKNEQGEYEKYELCDRCGGVRHNAIPDVTDVHEPYFDEHLIDKTHPEGQWIHSRGQKAELLKVRGWREKRESKIPYIQDPIKREKYFKEHNYKER